MRTLVLGGIRSGKSQWAESQLDQHPAVRYVATGRGAYDDPAWARRVADHRERRPASWDAVETVDVAEALRSDRATPTIVDDIGGWLTGVLDRRGWDGGPLTAEVGSLVEAVGQMTADLVLVSPEVGLTVVPATESGRRFADELGSLNRRLADCCEQVVLVIAGQPLRIKPTQAAH
ncbi:MAG: bifunctional adenosylcobinamide kinase/adenosylcobinamide-phosphate guanylyltransferase [Mycobacterium sp.]|nr:bifunctional adenosylcobinamide kinase/adenosylcobinamide-phosphate guanylyltransferase [Mycobacterium sp.]